MQVHCSNSDFYNKANFFPKNIKSLIINLGFLYWQLFSYV